MVGNQCVFLVFSRSIILCNNLIVIFGFRAQWWKKPSFRQRQRPTGRPSRMNMRPTGRPSLLQRVSSPCYLTTQGTSLLLASIKVVPMARIPLVHHNYLRAAWYPFLFHNFVTQVKQFWSDRKEQMNMRPTGRPSLLQRVSFPHLAINTSCWSD